MLYNLLVIFIISFGLASAQRGILDSPNRARILRYDNHRAVNHNGIHGYGFRYDTSDGNSRVEEGQLKNNVLVVRGQYSYLGPDGVLYTVTYIADEKGFRATGAHIPKR